MNLHNILGTLKKMGRRKAGSFYDFLHNQKEFNSLKRRNMRVMIEQYAEHPPTQKSYKRRTVLPLYFNMWINRSPKTAKEHVVKEYSKRLQEYWESVA